MVVDPPWENASAQRSSAYPTLPSRNLLGVPMKRLLHQVCLELLMVPIVMRPSLPHVAREMTSHRTYKSLDLSDNQCMTGTEVVDG